MKTKATASCLPDLEISVCQAAKENAGEDCLFRCFGREASAFGVFDGCGGSGAQRHAAYTDNTEAYMASRLCAGAFHDSFQDLIPFRDREESLLQAYLQLSAERCGVTLATYQPPASGGGIKGSIVRVLPSTAAVMLVETGADGSYRLSAVWAGDSRCYLLQPEGIAQLTEDDSTVPDPMENLYVDGRLKNLISQDKPLHLRVRTLECRPPFAVICATDGCFGYFTTPMEFEGTLLQTLRAAATPAQWETLLSDAMGRVAGDDYTLCLAAYGFADFKALQKAFAPRTRDLTVDFLNQLRQLPKEDRAAREPLWEAYKPGYLRYIEEE